MKPLTVGAVYTITLGEHSDKYLYTDDGPISGRFKRVRLPKSKIDDIRLPENIHISLVGYPVTGEPLDSNHKK